MSLIYGITWSFHTAVFSYILLFFILMASLQFDSSNTAKYTTWPDCSFGEDSGQPAHHLSHI